MTVFYSVYFASFTHLSVGKAKCKSGSAYFAVGDGIKEVNKCGCYVGIGKMRPFQLAVECRADRPTPRWQQLDDPKPVAPCIVRCKQDSECPKTFHKCDTAKQVCVQVKYSSLKQRNPQIQFPDGVSQGSRARPRQVHLRAEFAVGGRNRGHTHLPPRLPIEALEGIRREADSGRVQAQSTLPHCLGVEIGERRRTPRLRARFILHPA